MLTNVFNALCSMLINLFSLGNKAIKGTDTFMGAYCDLADLTKTNSERLVDDAKTINILRKQEQEQRIQAKFKLEQEQWAPLTEPAPAPAPSIEPTKD